VCVCDLRLSTGGGASADALTAFYNGQSTRILIGAIFGGMTVLNLMWFAAALRATLADEGENGWGSAATAGKCGVGGLSSYTSPSLRA